MARARLATNQTSGLQGNSSYLQASGQRVLRLQQRHGVRRVGHWRHCEPLRPRLRQARHCPQRVPAHTLKGIQNERSDAESVISYGSECLDACQRA